MARIRTIKPEFWTSEQIMECSPMARLLFIGIWNFADDHGRHSYSPKQFKALIFPADDVSIDDVSRMFDELSANGLISPYEVDSKRYFEVTGWHHQKIDKRQPPKFPTPPADYSSNSRRMVSTERKGRERRGEEEKNPPLRSGFSSPEPLDAAPADAAPPPEVASDPPDEVAQAFSAYNEAAPLARWPVARRLDKRRSAALRQRLAECGGLPGWRNALARARASPHLCGVNDRGWTADLDFLLQPRSFNRLLEGAYDDRRPRHDGSSNRPGGPGRRGDQHPLATALDELDERFRTERDA